MEMKPERPRLARSIRVAVMAVLIGSSAGTSSAGREENRPTTVFFATADSGTKVIAIEGRQRHEVTVRLIGATGAIGCLALTIGPEGTFHEGTAYSMCRTAVGGPQQLSTIDLETGQAMLTGAPIVGLDIMGLEFSPDGLLYAVGDTNRASPTFNSLYMVDTATGVPARVGSTGAPNFLMDFAFEREGTMFAASSFALYRIDPATALAEKVVDFIGGAAIMGLGFDRHGRRLYVTDFKSPASDFYRVDMNSGFLTPLARTGFANSHSLALGDR